MERGWKPNAEVSPACPRCGSSNTKFCYYNNYSLTQPRYFCKGCRRYWTKGGSLRNVPIGGGCRKSRRGKPTRVSTDRNSAHNRIESGGPISSRPETSTSNNNIDLAKVYANFLNQTPRAQIETVSELHEGIVNIPPIEFSNFPVGSHLPPENEFFECGQFPARLPETQLFGPTGGDSAFSGGLDPFQKQQFPMGNSFTSVNPMESDLLPPLPGEELWPQSDVIMQNQILHSDQELRLDVQPDEQNLVNGNLSPFCGLNLEAFFRS